MGSTIYREEALDGRNAGEQLDRLLQVTEPRDWLWLGALLLLGVCFVLWGIFGWVKHEIDGIGVIQRIDSAPSLVSPLPGLVKTTAVKRGDPVVKGQLLVTLQTPDGQTLSITAPHDGVVSGIFVEPGIYVQAGTVLLMTQDPKATVGAEVFVPLADSHELEVGMEVRCAPESTRSSQWGFAVGHITGIDAMASNDGEMRLILQNDALLHQLSKGSWVHISITLDRDPETPSGVRWTSGKGPPWQLWDRGPCSVIVLLGAQHPRQLFLGVEKPTQ